MLGGQKLNSADADSENTKEAPQADHVLRRTGCTQEDYPLLRETTRFDLDRWMKTLPQPWTAAMEATVFTGWIYDRLHRHAAAPTVAHPLNCVRCCNYAVSPWWAPEVGEVQRFPRSESYQPLRVV